MHSFRRLLSRVTGFPGSVAGAVVLALLFGFLLVAIVLSRRIGESSTDGQLLDLVDTAINCVKNKEVRTDHYTPWEVMHAMIPFGKALEVYDAEQGMKVNGIRWLLERATFDGKRIFQPVEGGIASWDSGQHFQVQDHPDQYLAKLGRAGVALDEKVIIDGQTYTIADMVNAAQLAITPEQEVSWSLTAFILYLGLDAKWKNSAGMEFDIPMVLKMEVEAEPTEGACGGTHGLFALAHAVNQMRKAGRTLDGPWQEAVEKIERYKQIAFEWQDDAGCFSARFFRMPARPTSDDYLLFSTGHSLEFLALACTNQEIGGSKMRKAVEVTARKLLENLDKDLRKGTLYHAVDGLLLYRQRIAGKVGKLGSAGTLPAALWPNWSLMAGKMPVLPGNLPNRLTRNRCAWAVWPGI
jgi:hypothetical protein